MKPLLIASSIAFSLVLASCSQSAPKCGEREVTDLVKEIAGREMTKQLGADASKLFSFDVQAIRTKETNEKTGAQQCAAELKINASNGGTNELAITYTVERTDDGKSIYVNVFGLE